MAEERKPKVNQGPGGTQRPERPQTQAGKSHGTVKENVGLYL